jgi:hypothetical protein
MLELKELEVKFKFKGEEYSINELTVGDLENLEKEVKNEDMTEVGLYRKMMKLAGLDEKVANQLSLRHLKQLAEAINKEK